MVNRLAEFHGCPSEESGWLSNVDPECAQSLFDFWQMLKHGVENRDASTPTSGDAVCYLEADIYRAVAKNFEKLSREDRETRFARMHPERVALVRKFGGWGP